MGTLLTLAGIAGAVFLFESIMGHHHPGIVAVLFPAATNNRPVPANPGIKAARRDRDAGLGAIDLIYAAIVGGGRDVAGDEATGLHGGTDVCVSGLFAAAAG